MESPIPCASSSCEQCSVVQFLTTEKILAKIMATRLKNMYGEAAMSSQTVRSWVEWFKAGRNVHDDDRSGWPSDAVNDETTAGSLALFERDRR